MPKENCNLQISKAQPKPILNARLSRFWLYETQFVEIDSMFSECHTTVLLSYLIINTTFCHCSSIGTPCSRLKAKCGSPHSCQIIYSLTIGMRLRSRLTFGWSLQQLLSGIVVRDCLGCRLAVSQDHIVLFNKCQTLVTSRHALPISNRYAESFHCLVSMEGSSCEDKLKIV